MILDIIFSGLRDLKEFVETAIYTVLLYLAFVFCYNIIYRKTYRKNRINTDYITKIIYELKNKIRIKLSNYKLIN
jgi:hypothetical protein